MKSLKLQNVPMVLVFVTWCIALLLVCIDTPNSFWDEIDRRFAELSAKDGFFLVLAPFILLIANGLFPSTFKAALVFWRIKYVLPGHRAFSIHANADPRINVRALRERVSPWPSNPKDENRTWYSLYRTVENTVRVVHNHRSFLLARDLASISFIFLVAGTPTVLILNHSTQWTLAYTAIVLMQYVVLAVVARNHGVRFVCNVFVEVLHRNETSVAE